MFFWIRQTFLNHILKCKAQVIGEHSPSPPQYLIFQPFSVCSSLLITASWLLISLSLFERERESLSVGIWLFVAPWTVQSMEFSRSESFPFPEDLPNLGIKPRSPALQVNSLPAEPQGKPKNTGVGRLSLLQRIFPTQEWNQGVLHCRWILYQLSYQGSPVPILVLTKYTIALCLKILHTLFKI